MPVKDGLQDKNGDQRQTHSGQGYACLDRVRHTKTKLSIKKKMFEVDNEHRKDTNQRNPQQEKIHSPNQGCQTTGL